MRESDGFALKPHKMSLALVKSPSIINGAIKDLQQICVSAQSLGRQILNQTKMNCSCSVLCLH